MKVESLTLRDFRNIRECVFRPGPGLNFIVGENGQGKTSLLEALSLLATLRSFRGSQSDELIRWGSQRSEIACEISEDGEWQTELKIVFEFRENGKATKSAFINGKAYRSSSEYLSQRFGDKEIGFHAVVFNPADHELIRGEPAQRRSYLDRVLAAEDIGYLRKLQTYQRLVAQRNAALKASERPDRRVIAGFTEPMARLAAEIVLERLDWLARLEPRIAATARQIAPRQAGIRPAYQSGWLPINPPSKGGFLTLKNGENTGENNKLSVRHFAGQDRAGSLELIEQAFWTRLSALEEAELRSRTTLVGPHRDDWGLLLGDQALKGHGSQGEVRSALLALKLSEIELFEERTGHRPLLLLDDFSSELDRQRRRFLLEFLKRTRLQVLITTTEEASVPAFEEAAEEVGRQEAQKVECFRVEGGQIGQVTQEVL